MSPSRTCFSTLSGFGTPPAIPTISTSVTVAKLRIRWEAAAAALLLPVIIRIDEVRKQGVSKIVALEGANVAQFPMPLLPPSASDPGPKKT